MGAQPVSKARHERHGTLRSPSRSLFTPVERSQRQHPVSEIANVRAVNLEHLKRFREVSEKLPQAIVPRVPALQLNVLQLDDGVGWKVSGANAPRRLGPKASMHLRNRSTFSFDIAHAISRGGCCFPCKAAVSGLPVFKRDGQPLPDS